MTTSSAEDLKRMGLPEAVARFADRESGLIVFAGADAAAVSTSAIALTRHVRDVTGRTAAVITSGQETADLLDLRFALRTANDRFDQLQQVRKAAGDGARVILIDCRMDGDTLIGAVEAAGGGALVILTLPFGDHPYSQLLDLLQSTEDTEIRLPFDAALYAVVQPGAITDGNGAPAADVFIPVARNEVQ